MIGGVVHEGKGGDYLGDDSFFVDGLCFEPQSAEKPVLSDVGFSLEKGHFYGILGANGSGKTSLLRHLLRLLPSKKTICFGGHFWKSTARGSWQGFSPTYRKTPCRRRILRRRNWS